MRRQALRVGIAAFLLARVLFQSFASGADAGREIEADFSTHSYDRWLFRAHTPMRGPAWGRWDLSGPGLRAMMPAGRSERGPLRFVGLFELHGDFEITAQFAIRKLPRPKLEKASNRIEVAVRGQDGTAGVYRHLSRDSEGFGFRRDRSHNVRLASAKVTTGRLQVERRGSQLIFRCGEGSGPLEQIGTSEFGEDARRGDIPLG